MLAYVSVVGRRGGPSVGVAMATGLGAGWSTDFGPGSDDEVRSETCIVVNSNKQYIIPG